MRATTQESRPLVAIYRCQNSVEVIGEIAEPARGQLDCLIDGYRPGSGHGEWVAFRCRERGNRACFNEAVSRKHDCLVCVWWIVSDSRA
jgi:hypothetical protein